MTNPSRQPNTPLAGVDVTLVQRDHDEPKEADQFESADCVETIDQLLVHWEIMRERQQDVGAEQLCGERTDLIPEVQRRIEVLRSMDSVFETEQRDLEGWLSNESAVSGKLPTIPGYELEAEVGRGGMGVVYRARQLGLNRAVALKMIVAAEHASSEQRSRFRTEAEAVARLQHPNIIQIHEIGQYNGLPFFSMEFVAGGSLAENLNRVPQPAVEAARTIETLARAVQAAHERGVVHRDLKPENILLTEEGLLKVTDFGLAKQVDIDSGQTQTGSVLGTPSYMAPEQAAGKTSEIGPASDVYALGAILFEMLVGRPPFQASTPYETIRQVLNQDPLPPSRIQAETPRDLETVCLKCLDKRIDHRYASATELAEDLRRFLAGEPIMAKPSSVFGRGLKFARRRPAVAALSMVSLAAVFTILIIGTIYNAHLQAANADLRTTKNALQQETTNLLGTQAELQAEVTQKRRLLSLSFIAYGRACALAAKEANLDDPFIVKVSRTKNLSKRYERQFQLEYELISQAGDPSVQPSLEALAKGLRESRLETNSHDLRQLSLDFAHACGAAWQRETRDYPELQKTIRKNLYGRATAVVGRIVKAATLEQARHEYSEFWELYWGDLVIVESPEVERAMKHFGDLLKQWDAKGYNASQGKLSEPLQKAAAALNAACGADGWQFPVGNRLRTLPGNRSGVKASAVLSNLTGLPFFLCEMPRLGGQLER